MYLSSEQLDALQNYRYTSGMYGVVDTLMTPFWNWAVTLLPLSLAPNLVTLIALMCMFSASAVVVLVNPTLYQSIPTWAALYCSVCIFLYQTLDAIDGKQARRTGSSSPLGQLFDHGCDSVNVTLLLIVISGCIQTGDNPYLIAGLYVIFTLPFYMANWEEFQTGSMRFGVVGVTEAQWTMVAILIATATFGTEIWEHSFLGLNYRTVVVCIATIGSLFGSLENIYKVFWDKSTTLCSTYVRRDAIAQLIQFWLFLLLTVLWMISPHYKQIYECPVVPLLTAGLSFSYCINRLIVAKVTHCPAFSACHYVIIPLSIVTCLSWSSSSSTTMLSLYVYAVYIATLYSHFVVVVIQEICDCLKIRPFSIVVKTE